MGQHGDESIDVGHPSTLRIEVASTADMFDDAIAVAEAFETESEQPRTPAEAVMSFNSIQQLREVMTTQRLELVESLLTASVDSASQLAERLDRPTAAVLDDIDALATAGIIARNDGDPTNRLSVPYDRVVIEYSIEPDASTVDPDSAA